MREGIEDGRRDRTDVLTFAVRRTRMSESNGRVTFAVLIYRELTDEMLMSLGAVTDESREEMRLQWKRMIPGRVRDAPVWF